MPKEVLKSIDTNKMKKNDLQIMNFYSVWYNFLRFLSPLSHLSKAIW